MEAIQHSVVPRTVSASRLPAQVGVVAAVVVMLACMGVIFANQFDGNIAHPGTNVVIGAAK